MSIRIQNPVGFAAIFFWLGMVGAISFMEAWLKFTAPGITLPLGLGIGRLVFHALNRVELILGIILLTSFFYLKQPLLRKANLFLLLPILILLTQTFWLLPALDMRAEMHIQGQNVPPSNLHFLYIVFEVLKFLGLGGYAWTLLKT